MGSTRNKVLQTLLNNQRCTINDLAEIVEINPISVRHHIAKLEADGLVTSEEERHGVGRPRRIYFLTNKGMELFPTRYLNLSIRLVEKLKSSLPEVTVKKLFEEMAGEIVDDHIAHIDISGLEPEERITLIKELLSNQGFTIEVEAKDDGFEIRETSCPYKHVGEEHPEICLVDEAMIAKILSMDIEKTHCVLDGDPYCCYRVPALKVTEIKISE